MALPPVSDQNFQSLLPEEDLEEESTGNSSETADTDAQPGAPPALQMITHPDLAALVWEREQNSNAGNGGSPPVTTSSGNSPASPDTGSPKRCHCGFAAGR